MLRIEKLDWFDTKYCADAIAWCTYPKYRQYFVCGTYQNIENPLPPADASSTASRTCQRKGCIYLYKFNREDLKKVKQLQMINTAAILDMKWLYSTMEEGTEMPSTIETAVLAVANALGQIELFQLDGDGDVVQLRKLSDFNLYPSDDGILALSLDVRKKNIDPTGSYDIMATDSKGIIHLLNVTNDYKLIKSLSWFAHHQEAWCCEFDKMDNDRIYTGGDDNKLHIHDLRLKSFMLTNKSHTAGVTSLLSHHKRRHILLTGSYDEHIRVFDSRSFQKPLAEFEIGGGVWRMKFDPIGKDLLLAACMHKNFSILHLMDNNMPVVKGEFNEHQSICYGADWCFDIADNEKSLFMATCSFYDRKLCLSKFDF